MNNPRRDLTAMDFHNRLGKGKIHAAMINPNVIIFRALLLLALIFPTVRPDAARLPEVRLAVSFDVPRSKIIGAATVIGPQEGTLTFSVGDLIIRSVRLDRKNLPFRVQDGILNITIPARGVVEIRYEGIFRAEARSPHLQDAAFQSVIDRRGVFLVSGWYPQLDGRAIHRLEASLPRGYTAISEAENITQVEHGDQAIFTFEFDRPVGGINLIATNRYRIARNNFNGIDLVAYFFREDQGLAARYLNYAKKYIGLYEKLLLPFPFKRFAIVENFLPTGYSMPTYTLLGQDIVRLPFIVETSLGHEILHQWFGNQVYPAELEGNWTEGLATYLADHYYQEQKGEGWRYRKEILLDYGSYVGEENDFPLTEFFRRFNFASRAIGYGKAAMLFHMLRQREGDGVFFAALRRFIRQKQFQRASWSDLRRTFEKQTGQSLAPFFTQWLDRKGLPELRPGNVAFEHSGSGFILSFDMLQNAQAYDLEVPVTVIYKSGGKKKEKVRLRERRQSFRLELAHEPDKIVIDENYDVARKLTEPEIPPRLAGLLGGGKLIVVRPVRDEVVYKAAIDAFKKKGAEVKYPDQLKDAEIQTASVLVLGKENPLIRRLFGSMEIAGTGFSLVAKKNPLNLHRIVGIVASESAAETRLALPKIFHYGKYSALHFEQGINVSKTIDPSERGIQAAPVGDPGVVDLSSLNSLSQVIDKVASKKIVYVGEEHDHFSHHQVQLRILQGLHQKNPKIAVGMEMFQKPFQQALDDYVAGTIDERAFLKRSEYFKRWGFDYHLYKPILDFARTQRIPVVALNLPREIVSKVSKSGLDSLSKEEKRQIPSELDFSDEDYRQRLEAIFKSHPNSEAKDFNLFLQAQLVWDETMAESIDAFLKNNSGFRIVVLAGAGHLRYGSGIPKRAFRRNGHDYTIILSDAEIEKEIADFVVFPQPSKAPTAPKLMVILKENNQQVQIADFTKDSVSQKAGLEVGDILVALDSHPVESIEDVRIALFYKKPGDEIAVKVKRSGALFGAEEQEFKVTLSGE